MRQICTILAVLLFFVALASSSYAELQSTCPVDTNTLTTDTNYYSTLQCNVADAGNDGVLKIGANSITIDCNGMVLFGNRTGYGIANTAGYDNITIKNCNLGSYKYGIYMYNAGNLTEDLNFLDNNIQRSTGGLYLRNTADANIHSNVFDNNNLDGLYIQDSTFFSITDNNISDNNTDGAYLSSVQDFNILRNEISYNIRFTNAVSGSANLVITGGTSQDINIQDNNIVKAGCDSPEYGASCYPGLRLNACAGSISIIDNNFVGRLGSPWSGDQAISNAATCDGTVIRFNSFQNSGSASGVTVQGDDTNILDNNFLRCNILLTNANRTLVKDNNIYFGKIVSQTAGSDNNISGNTIVRSWFASPPYSACISVATTSNHIEDNNVSSCDVGITVSGTGNSIRDNNISDANSAAISLTESAGTNVVLLNIIRDSNVGISLASSSLVDNNIYSNYIDQDNNWGINIRARSRNNISDNNISDANYGIVLDAAATDANIFNNAIKFNRIAGIWANGAFDVNIVDNNISRNAFSGFLGTLGWDINLVRCHLRNNGTSDVNLEDTNILFLDGNYLTSSFVDANATLRRAWFVDLNIVAYPTLLPINGASISVRTQASVQQFAWTSAASGAAPSVNPFIQEYDQGSGGKTLYTPHSLVTSITGLDTNTYSLTVDRNRAVVIYLNGSPQITAPTSSQVFIRTDVTLQYSAHALLLPIATYWVKVDNGPWQSNGTATAYPVTFSGSGAHTFYLKGTGGNIGDNNTTEASVSFLIDLSPRAVGCGDNACGSGEAASNCPIDCPPVCGDGACTHIESPESCPEDCLAVCGDGVCSGNESRVTCPMDCLNVCGDGHCDAGESCDICPADCHCETPGEETPTPEQPVRPPALPMCAGISCNDNNPCTVDVCFEGECVYVVQPDGITCGFGMECFSGGCLPVAFQAALKPPIIISETISLLALILRILGGDAFEEAPSLLALLLLLATAAAVLAYNRLRIYFPQGVLTSRERLRMRAVLAVVAIVAFVLPFIVNRTVGILYGIVFALAEIAAIMLLYQLRKRSLERKALKV